MINLSGEKYLITGATSGIGLGVVKLLNSLGAFIVLSGRNEKKLNEVKKNLPNPDNSEVFVLDLLTEFSAKSFFKESTINSGLFSGMVHCAGLDITKPYKLLKSTDFEKLNRLNVIAPFQLAKELVKKDLFSPNGGSLVWVSSVMGFLGQKGKIAYSASKASIEGLVKSFALELATRKIRVNSIAPGIVKTPLTEDLFRKLSSEAIQEIEKMHPLGFGETEDVANLIAFLMSNKSKWITGSNYFIDGGYHIQ
jgi:NAD(P)-dependent dehydrogenase (short-subunit alcohol dehydrogenase family)